MREILPKMAGSHFYIWFIFYVSLPNQMKLLLFNIFFFGILRLDSYAIVVMSNLIDLIDI